MRKKYKVGVRIPYFCDTIFLFAVIGAIELTAEKKIYNRG
jgi:hypothetical protein